MATVLSMPKLSATMAEATVVRWYKAAGDRVLSGEVVLEIETDKATLTIEAPATGVLGTPAVAAGEVAAVGAALVTILNEGERHEIERTRAKTVDEDRFTRHVRRQHSTHRMNHLPVPPSAYRTTSLHERPLRVRAPATARAACTADAAASSDAG